jgi:hypothetical protein
VPFKVGLALHFTFTCTLFEHLHHLLGETVQFLSRQSLEVDPPIVPELVVNKHAQAFDRITFRLVGWIILIPSIHSFIHLQCMPAVIDM